MSEKIYVGSAKKIEFNNGGHLHKISFRTEDLEKMLMKVNDAGWVNVNLCARKEPSEKGQTHYLVIDDWKPKEKKKKPEPETMTEDEFDSIGFDDLPF